jgi:hypothetical protein
MSRWGWRTSGSCPVSSATGSLHAGLSPRVHEEDAGPGLDEGLRAQPGKEFVAVGSGQDVGDGVASVHGARAASHREQMQVVIAEHAARVERLEKAQRPKRVGAAIHEIAHGFEAIGRGVEAHTLEQPLEFVSTALDIADEDGARHWRPEATPEAGRATDGCEGG